MKTERIVLSIIAILIGLFVAGIAFYFIQLNNKPKGEEHVVSITTSPTPTPKSSFLSVTSPENESVSSSKSIQISGKAPAGSTVIISTENGQSVVVATPDGTFSDTVSLDEGVNLISVTALQQDGKKDNVIHTVTYSTESF